MHLHFIEEPDKENLLIDSTIVCAHPCAEGASAEKGARGPSAMQKSKRFQHEGLRERRCFGQPVRFILTARQEHDITQAEALMGDAKCERVIADKGYDSDAFREYVGQSGTTSVWHLSSRLLRKALSHTIAIMLNQA